MVGAWQHIVEFALERLGRSAPGLAEAVARDYAVRRREAMTLFPEALGCLTDLPGGAPCRWRSSRTATPRSSATRSSVTGSRATSTRS